MVEKKVFELRELNEQEKQDLKCIVMGELPGEQLLLGVMAIDLLEDEEKEGFIRYETLRERIKDKRINGRKLDEYMSMMSLLELWITKCMSYKKYTDIEHTVKEVRGLSTNIQAAVFTFLGTLGGMWSGTISKKEREIEAVYFEKVEKPFDRELSMRFIVSALDYIGFHRKKTEGEYRVIDVSMITYDEYYDFTREV